jgi:hypothetical protein
VPRKLKALLILIAATLMLPACAASPPAPGNNKAGVLRWFAANAQAVQAEVDRPTEPHCAQLIPAKFTHGLLPWGSRYHMDTSLGELSETSAIGRL